MTESLDVKSLKLNFHLNLKFIRSNILVVLVYLSLCVFIPVKSQHYSKLRKSKRARIENDYGPNFYINNAEGDHSSFDFVIKNFERAI